MTARLRYGVIGTGMLGLERLRNLALLPGAEVVAYADPHQESRRWVIVTPNHTHRAVLEDAFATRKHILRPIELRGSA